MTREEDLLNFMLSRLVDDPEQLAINVVEGSRSTILEVRSTPDDIGKIIGRRGRIIKALRIIMSAAATRSNKRVVLEVLDKPDGTSSRSERDYHDEDMDDDPDIDSHDDRDED